MFLQEVCLSTDQIRNLLRGYDAVVNVDENNLSRPGTAIVWKEGIPVVDACSVVPCRAQVASLGNHRLMNVYAPSGSDKKYERSVFFGQELFSFLLSDSSSSWICGGDYNAILEPIDVEGGKGFDQKKCPALADLVKSAGLTDIFRFFFPGHQEFTFYRANCAASRLDRFYLSNDLINEVQSVCHMASLSDHFGIKMRILLPIVFNNSSRSKGRSTYWKLNNAILEDEFFLSSFKALWHHHLNAIENFSDIADWWDLLMKPKIREFCISFSKERNFRRICLKKFLLSSLKIASVNKDWDEVLRIKSELDTMIQSDLMGFVVRSRFQQNAESERASLFHACKEVKNDANNITALKIGNDIVTDAAQIESEVMRFFFALFNGYHKTDLSISNSPFTPENLHLHEFLSDLPVLDPDIANSMHEQICRSDLDSVIKSCSNNKAPGLDGLSYEFYKVTWDVIGDTFLDVLQCQLNRLNLIDSNRNGATRLIPKVSGTPRVDELRPLTLLNCDYRILSKIMVQRLKPALPYVIKSGQLCTIERKNILFGISNIMSSITYANQHDLGVCLLSLDYFKAYDRVLLSFLLVVMKKMGISAQFCCWIQMMHDGQDEIYSCWRSFRIYFLKLLDQAG